MRKQMTIGKKLMFGFGVLVAMLAAFGAYSMVTIGRMDDIQNNLADRQARKLILVGNINNLAEEMGVGERDLILSTIAGNAAEGRKSAEDARRARAEFEKSLNEVRPMLDTERGRELAAVMEETSNRIVPVFEEIVRLCGAGQGLEAEKVRVEKSELLGDKLNSAASELQSVIKEVVVAVSTQADGEVARNRWTTIAMIVLSVLVGVPSFFGVVGINRQLRQLAMELGRGAEQVASAASQVSASSQSLAQGSSEQAASLEEASASSEEINSMARKNTETTQTVSGEMEKSAQLVSDSNTRLEEMVASMKDITDSSGKVSKIIKVIDEIAFQTNILALNAAVEAARAGEAGMGFAVVADEVRNLAQRCAQAAKDTAALIEESIQNSATGSRNLGQVAEGVRAITTSANQVKTLVDEVNLSSREQARGIEQIGKAIVQMEQVTQKTAANAEESAAAAEELNAQSDALKAVVGRLMAMVGGGESGADADDAQPRRHLARLQAS